MPNIPNGVSQEDYDRAKMIITSGFQNKADANQIKTEMFKHGIKFSDLMRLYSAITIGERLVINPAEVKAGIEMELVEEFTPETTYEELEIVINRIVEAVDGATEKRVYTIIRNKMRGMGFDAPKKPRPKKVRKPKINKAHVVIVNCFKENLDCRKDQLREKLLEVTTEKGADRWLGMYPLFSALANNFSSEEGLKVE